MRTTAVHAAISVKRQSSSQPSLRARASSAPLDSFVAATKREPTFQARKELEALLQCRQVHTALGQQVVSDRFEVGCESVSRALLGPLEAIDRLDVSSSDGARAALVQLTSCVFTDIDTRARFMAFASTRLSDGRTVMQALERGALPVGAHAVELARELQGIAASFCAHELSELCAVLTGRFVGRPGERYMTQTSERAALQTWLG